MMKFIKDENGQGMLEYVLIIALVVIAVVAIVVGVRSYLQRQNLEDKLNNLDTTAPAGA